MVKKSLYANIMYRSRAVRDTKSRYYSKLWPTTYYPTYPSGAGILMNRKMAMALQYYTKITPKINIDDAFIGVVLSRAGLDQQQFMKKGFNSYGFARHTDNWDVCKLNKVIYSHKYVGDELSCLWPKFIKNR